MVMGILTPSGFCQAVLPQLMSIAGQTWTPRNRVFIDMGLGGGHLLAFCHQLGIHSYGIELCRDYTQVHMHKRPLGVPHDREMHVANIDPKSFTCTLQCLTIVIFAWKKTLT
jgi:hypothetical protein